MTTLPTVFADQNQMIQVFQNLITNAIKFHGHNPPEINISAQKDKKEWKFAVTDNGIGIELNIKNKYLKYLKDYTQEINIPVQVLGFL